LSTEEVRYCNISILFALSKKCLLLSETPATATDRIFFEGDTVHERAPAEIKISWNKYNLTTSESAAIKISLWGYKETTIRPELLYIDMIEVGYVNMLTYVIIDTH
jgi:hypothetical protein